MVGTAELAYIRRVGTYGWNENHSGKYFADSQAAALNLRNHGTWANATLTSTTIPTRVYFMATRIRDPGGAGLSLFYTDQQLHIVYSTMTPIVVYGR